MTQEQVGYPSAQIPLSDDLVEHLGTRTIEYAEALWSVAQERSADAEDMAALIRLTNARFDVEFPDMVVDRLQEIFRESGGFVTIIHNDDVLAGSMSDAGATEPPHSPDIRR